MQRPLLTTPLALRGVTARNRVAISPMLQYSGAGGMPTEWHDAHVSRLALGGAGIIFVEATAVEQRGMITYGDLGLWDDGQIAPMRRLAETAKRFGAVPALQLAHAGRKAGTQRPWDGHGPLGEADAAKGEPPWTPIGPSPIPASPGRTAPAEITAADIAALKEAWRTATLRAGEAGFEAVEIHGAHGYLLHTFLSPHSNQRTDAYGGDVQGRMRFPLEIAEIVRAAWPAHLPLFYRVSAVDEGGWTIEETVTFARELAARGVDVIDCSSGSLHDSSTANVRLKRGFGFQVPFAEQVRREAGVMTMAVGLIIDPQLAEGILQSGRADIVAIGRESLFNPGWPLHAEQVLGADRRFASWPKQHGWWLDKRATIIENIRREAS